MYGVVNEAVYAAMDEFLKTEDRSCPRIGVAVAVLKMPC
jgi:hypothetical protein